MSSPEELLKPLKGVLDDLTSFAHERYFDAVKSSEAMPDQLRLVAAAEGFQTLAAVHQISRAVSTLEQTLGDIEYWSKQPQLLLGDPVSGPDPLELPRSLLATGQPPQSRHGILNNEGVYSLALGNCQIKIWDAGGQVVEPGRGVIIEIDGGETVVAESVWRELDAIITWLMADPPPVKGGEVEK